MVTKECMSISLSLLGISFDEDDVGDNEAIEIDYDPDLLVDDDCFRI